jgi:hypothetical protein
MIKHHGEHQNLVKVWLILTINGNRVRTFQDLRLINRSFSREIKNHLIGEKALNSKIDYIIEARMQLHSNQNYLDFP